MRLSATYRHRFAYGSETYWPLSISTEIAAMERRGWTVNDTERWKESGVSKFRVRMKSPNFSREVSILFRVFH